MRAVLVAVVLFVALAAPAARAEGDGGGGDGQVTALSDRRGYGVLVTIDADSVHTELFAWSDEFSFRDAVRRNKVKPLALDTAGLLAEEGVMKYVREGRADEAGEALRAGLGAAAELIPASVQHKTSVFVALPWALRDTLGKHASVVLDDVKAVAGTFPFAFAYANARFVSPDQDLHFLWVSANYLLRTFNAYDDAAHKHAHAVILVEDDTVGLAVPVESEAQRAAVRGDTRVANLTFADAVFPVFTQHVDGVGLARMQELHSEAYVATVGTSHCFNAGLVTNDTFIGRVVTGEGSFAECKREIRELLVDVAEHPVRNAAALLPAAQFRVLGVGAELGSFLFGVLREKPVSRSGLEAEGARVCEHDWTTIKNEFPHEPLASLSWRCFEIAFHSALVEWLGTGAPSAANMVFSERVDGTQYMDSAEGAFLFENDRTAAAEPADHNASALRTALGVSFGMLVLLLLLLGMFTVVFQRLRTLETHAGAEEEALLEMSRKDSHLKVFTTAPKLNRDMWVHAKQTIQQLGWLYSRTLIGSVPVCLYMFVKLWLNKMYVEEGLLSQSENSTWVSSYPFWAYRTEVFWDWGLLMVWEGALFYWMGITLSNKSRADVRRTALRVTMFFGAVMFAVVMAFSIAYHAQTNGVPPWLIKMSTTAGIVVVGANAVYWGKGGAGNTLSHPLKIITQPMAVFVFCSLLIHFVVLPQFWRSGVQGRTLIRLLFVPALVFCITLSDIHSITSVDSALFTPVSVLHYLGLSGVFLVGRTLLFLIGSVSDLSITLFILAALELAWNILYLPVRRWMRMQHSSISETAEWMRARRVLRASMREAVVSVELITIMVGPFMVWGLSFAYESAPVDAVDMLISVALQLVVEVGVDFVCIMVERYQGVEAPAVLSESKVHDSIVRLGFLMFAMFCCMGILTRTVTLTYGDYVVERGLLHATSTS